MNRKTAIITGGSIGIGAAITRKFDYDEEDFKKIINTNVLGTFYITKYASKYMIEGKSGGSIINISSINCCIWQYWYFCLFCF